MLPVLTWHAAIVGVPDLRNPVDECAAFELVALRNRVDDRESTQVPREDHRATRRQRRADGEPAPHGDAVPFRRPLVGIELPANHGMDAIAPHEQVGLDTPGGRPCLIDELTPDRASLLLPEADEMVVGVDALATEAVEHCPVQDAEELAAVDAQLGPVIAGGKASRFTPDQLAVLRVVLELRGGETDARELIEEPDLGQPAPRVGEDIDAAARLLQDRRGLVAVHVVDAPTEQGRAQRHPADSSSGDRDPHRLLCSAGPYRASSAAG